MARLKPTLFPSPRIDEKATEDNTFANKTFLSIDEKFALNATSLLDQPLKLREDFASSQINLDLLSYSKESNGYAI